MNKKTFIISLLVLTAVVISACGSNQKPQPPQINSDNPVMPEQAPAEVQSTGIMKSVASPELPTWFSSEMIDVNTGSVFKLSDYQGKVILVETMAVWCSKCLSQQKEIAKLHTALSDRDDHVSVVIDIDPNEDAALLGNYAQKNNFTWLYAVASDEVINEISALYGAQFLNPPATPMLIIDKQGNSHPLPFGIKSAEELQAAMRPFLDAEG